MNGEGSAVPTVMFSDNVSKMEMLFSSSIPTIVCFNLLEGIFITEYHNLLKAVKKSEDYD